MTVTINTLGSYSRQILINGETSGTNIINAVNTSLIALGWTLYDSATSGSRGLLTTRVYSAANNDGPSPSTKYMIIRYDLQRQYWFTSCCESWNTTTKVATNESWYGARQILLPLQYSNCTLYVFATARYACFMGNVLGEPSAWQGVFEFERNSTEDVAAKSVPNFGWTSSLTIGEPYGNFNSTNAGASTTNGFVACGFATPRTANGLTGATAANNFTILTILGSYPPQKNQIGADWSTGGITQAFNSHNGMLGAWADNQAPVWNSNSTLIGNMNLTGYSSSYAVGKIYGLKIAGKLGAVLDTTTVPVDSDLFYSSSGSNITHYLLGIHGGYSDKFTSGSGKMSGSASTVSTVSLGTPWQSVLVSGRFIYFTTTTGFHKFDATAQSFTYNILPAAQYYAVKFDGGNNLYVTGATANIVYKVNLTDDTYTTLSMTGSWSGLAIDDSNLYVASRAAAASLVVKRVALSTFTEAASYTVTSGSASNYITHLATADYAGYIYVGILSSNTGSQNTISRINTSDGSLLTMVPSYSTGAGSTTGAQPVLFDGTNLNFMVMQGGTVTSYMLQVKISNFQVQQINSAATTTNNIYISTGLEILGACEPVSFAGMFLLNYTATAGSYRVVLSDPRITGTLFGGAGFAFDSLYNVYGQPCTDQCALYNLGTTRIIRYTGCFRNNNFLGAQSSNILIAQ